MIASSPTRLEILAIVYRATPEAISPVAIAKQLEQPTPRVAYHVRCLAEAGALKCVSTRPRRGATEHFYACGPKFLQATQASVVWATKMKRLADELPVIS